MCADQKFEYVESCHAGLHYKMHLVVYLLEVFTDPQTLHILECNASRRIVMAVTDDITDREEKKYYRCDNVAHKMKINEEVVESEECNKSSYFLRVVKFDVATKKMNDVFLLIGKTREGDIEAFYSLLDTASKRGDRIDSTILTACTFKLPCIVRIEDRVQRSFDPRFWYCGMAAQQQPPPVFDLTSLEQWSVAVRDSSDFRCLPQKLMLHNKTSNQNNSIDLSATFEKICPVRYRDCDFGTGRYACFQLGSINANIH